jgi:hypothetical protein
MFPTAADKETKSFSLSKFFIRPAAASKDKKTNPSHYFYSFRHIIIFHSSSRQQLKTFFSIRPMPKTNFQVQIF